MYDGSLDRMQPFDGTPRRNPALVGRRMTTNSSDVLHSLGASGITPRPNPAFPPNPPSQPFNPAGAVPRLRQVDRSYSTSHPLGAQTDRPERALRSNLSLQLPPGSQLHTHDYAGSGLLPSFSTPRGHKSGSLDRTSSMKGAMQSIRRTGTLSRARISMSTQPSLPSLWLQRLIHSDTAFISSVQVVLGLALCAVSAAYLFGASCFLGLFLGAVISATGALALPALQSAAPPGHATVLRVFLTVLSILALVVLLTQVLTGKQVDCALAQLQLQTKANAHLLQENMASDSVRHVQHRITELEDLVHSLQEHTASALQTHHEMSAQQANDLAMLESRLAGLDHDATDLLQNALQALNAAKTSGKPWGPQDQEIFDQRANIANATIKRKPEMAPQLATVCCRIKRYHSGSPQDRRFSVAEYDRLLSALNGVAGMTSTSVPPDKQVLQTLKWRWEESERAGMALKRMSDAKYHEPLLEMLGPEHEQKMEKAEKQRKNFKTRSSHTVNRQVVRAADHRRALEAIPEQCQRETDRSWAFTFTVLLCFGWQFCAAYRSFLDILDAQGKSL